jgi:hypothetical protein
VEQYIFFSFSYFATTLLPGQDKLAPSAPMSGASSFVVSCGLRLSEVVLGGIRKPQVARLGHQSNPLNFKAEEGTQRRLDRLLTPMTRAISFTDNNVGFIPFLSLGDPHDGADHTVMNG